MDLRMCDAIAQTLSKRHDLIYLRLQRAALFVFPSTVFCGTKATFGVFGGILRRLPALRNLEELVLEGRQTE
jgi:hypothetical protein